MTSKVQQLFHDALALSPLERAALIEELMRSFDGDPAAHAAIQAAWVAESQDRIAAYQRGEIPARDADELFTELDRKYSA